MIGQRIGSGIDAFIEWLRLIGFYKHYKNHWYFVLGWVWESTNREDRARKILYYSFGEWSLNVREFNEFIEHVYPFKCQGSCRQTAFYGNYHCEMGNEPYCETCGSQTKMDRSQFPGRLRFAKVFPKKPSIWED